MAGPDPAISRQRQIRGSSPRMTVLWLSSFRRRREIQLRYCQNKRNVIAGLDPAISSRLADSRVKPANDGIVVIVIPAKAGKSSFTAPKLDPDFRQGDEENKERENFPLDNIPNRE